MNRGGRWLTIGLTVAVLFALLPGVASAPAAAQTGEGDPPPGLDQTWPDLADRTPPGELDQPAPDEWERAQQHIINGDLISINERPWHVLVSDETFFDTWCGGSILAANLILTAAHCVDNDLLQPRELLIVAGSDRWRDVDGGQWSYATNVTIHPSYDPDGGFDGGQGLDLALIELARPLTFTASVQPIDLADPTEAASVLGQNADMTGWGVTTLPADDGDTSTSLRNGVGRVISDTLCGALIGRSVNGPIEMCIDGIETNQTGCYGDSGGGTTIEIGGVRKLLGVNSFTIRGCEFDILVLSETTTARTWIDENTPPIATGPSFVNGRVWNDLDFDSTEDADEPGLADVEVTLTIPAPPFGDSSPLRLTTRTDGDGRYSFVAPFGGWYAVTAALDPMLVPSPPIAWEDDTTNSDALGRNRDPFLIEPTVIATSRFLVRPGSTENDIDLGATPGVLVSGAVFDDLNRDGSYDIANEPLSGRLFAYVDLYVTLDGGEKRRIDSHDLFDNIGVFLFPVPEVAAHLEFYDLFTDRHITVPVRDGERGNDFSPFTGETAPMTVVPNQSYEWDLGLTPAGTGDAFADVANTDCDGEVSIIDALVIAQYTAGLRADGATCPLPNPATQINVANADMNLDGFTDIIDALLVSQCDAGLATPFCTALN